MKPNPALVCFLVLDELVDSYALRGDLRRATHASELKLRLPVTGKLRQRIEYELLGLRASLN